MNLTETILAIAGTGGLSGMAAWIGKGYATKRAHDSRDHALDASTFGTTLATMVRLLEREQDAHNHTRDRLSQANTEIDLRGGQVGDIGARFETLTERFEELREEMREVRKDRDDCRADNERLERRIAVLEKRDTPDSTPRPILRPVQHEAVGGHE
jgi:septal ring factor EnvC (AmiA/AmiB activator)